MRVVIVAVGLPYIAFESVNGEVHLAQPDGFGDPFNPMNADLTVPILFVVMDKVCALDEHTTRPTGGIEDTSLKRFEDLHNELDDGGWGKELPAPLPFGHREVS